MKAPGPMELRRCWAWTGGTVRSTTVRRARKCQSSSVHEDPRAGVLHRCWAWTGGTVRSTTTRRETVYDLLRA